jgi:hypothetical protein
VGYGFEQLGPGDSVLEGAAEVVRELVGVPAGDQGGDGDEAAVPGRRVRGRFQTSSKSTSSVSSASLGATSPTARRPPPTCLG